MVVNPTPCERSGMPWAPASADYNNVKESKNEVRDLLFSLMIQTQKQRSAEQYEDPLRWYGQQKEVATRDASFF